MKLFGQISLGLFVLLILISLGFGMRACSIVQKHATNSIEISSDEAQALLSHTKEIMK